MRSIVRFNDATSQDVVFASAVAATGGFNMATASGGMLLVSATSTGGAIVLTFRTRMTEEASTTFAVANSSNTVVTLTVQPGRAYPIPDELFAATYVLATTASAGETVTCRVVTKS